MYDEADDDPDDDDGDVGGFNDCNGENDVYDDKMMLKLVLHVLPASHDKKTATGHCTLILNYSLRPPGH